MRDNKAKNVVLVAEDDDEDFNLMERAFKVLNLSKQIVSVKDGREALQEIKSNEWLRDIPVIVLTTSKSEEDVIHTYRLGVNSFIRKPARQKEFVEMIRSLSRYWFETVELPHRGERGRHD